MASDNSTHRPTALALRRELADHNHRYYVLDAPTITDAEYDSLFGQLQALEARHPELAAADSPTQTIGASTPGAKISHRTPMRSIHAVFDLDGCRDLDRHARAQIGIDAPAYIVEPKIDGAAISLIYRAGTLALAATRGDGKRGEDVTEAALCCPGIPSVLVGDHPDCLDVRGEVYLPTDRFQALNEARAAAGAKPLSHPRNAAAAALRGNGRLVADLALIAFDALDAAGQPVGDTLGESAAMLTRWGVPTDPRAECASGIDQALAIAERIGVARDRYATPIDGVVIKLDRRADQAKLGNGARAPRWAVALKQLPPPSPARQPPAIPVDAGNGSRRATGSARRLAIPALTAPQPREIERYILSRIRRLDDARLLKLLAELRTLTTDRQEHRHA